MTKIIKSNLAVIISVFFSDTASERGNEGNVTSCESDTSDESYEGERMNMGDSQVSCFNGRGVQSL